MNPPNIAMGGWRILKSYIFRELSFFEILGGGGEAILQGSCISWGGAGTFCSISYNINNEFFSSFTFHEDMMNNLIFSQKYFFCDSCFYATVQKFTLLDYVKLLDATVLGIALCVMLFYSNSLRKYCVIWTLKNVCIIVSQ